jgi:hypothetical protein
MISFAQFLLEKKSNEQIAAKVRHKDVENFKDFERAYYKKYRRWPKATEYKPVSWKKDLQDSVD